MRLLFITDIHGNANALRRFMNTVKRCGEHLSYDEAHCLGDVFGYYGEPYKSWSLVDEYVLSKGGRLQTGNHDILLGRWHPKVSQTNGDPADTAAISIALHRARLRREFDSLVEYNGLMERLTSDEAQRPYEDSRHPYHLIYVHGQPHGSQADDHGLLAAYLSPKTNATLEIRRALEFGAKRAGEIGKPVVIVYGHTHLPMLAYLQANGRIGFGGTSYTTPDIDHPVDLSELFGRRGDEAVRVIAVNPGSIGQPRDGVGEISEGYIHAHGLIIDTESSLLRFVAVRYAHTGLLSYLQTMQPVHDLETDDLLVLSRYLSPYYHKARLPLASPELVTGLGFNTPEDVLGFIQPADRTPDEWKRLARVYDTIWQHQIVPKMYGRLHRSDLQLARQDLFYDYTSQGFFTTDRIPR